MSRDFVFTIEGDSPKSMDVLDFRGTERTGGGRTIDVTQTLNILATDINIQAKRIRINGTELTDVKGGVIKLNCD